MARPIAKDYGEKRRLILDRAAQLFADEGFDRTSVNRLAQACEISKANIYHYYASKDDILYDILNAYLSDLRNRVLGIDNAVMSPKDRFYQAVTEILLAYQGADNEHRLQTMVLNHLPKDQQSTLVGYQRELVAHLSQIIAELSPEVLALDKAKLRAATMSVFGMLNWYYMWNKDADSVAREEYAKVICTLCLEGFQGL